MLVAALKQDTRKLHSASTTTLPFTVQGTTNQ